MSSVYRHPGKDWGVVSVHTPAITVRVGSALTLGLSRSRARERQQIKTGGGGRGISNVPGRDEFFRANK